MYKDLFNSSNKWEIRWVCEPVSEMQVNFWHSCFRLTSKSKPDGLGKCFPLRQFANKKRANIWKLRIKLACDWTLFLLLSPFLPPSASYSSFFHLLSHLLFLPHLSSLCPPVSLPLILSRCPWCRVMQTVLTQMMTGLPVILRRMRSRKTLCISQVYLSAYRSFLFNKDRFFLSLLNVGFSMETVHFVKIVLSEIIWRYSLTFLPKIIIELQTYYLTLFPTSGLLNRCSMPGASKVLPAINIFSRSDM